MNQNNLTNSGQLRIDQYAKITIHPTDEPAVGVALIMHGLNLLPGRMENIISELNERKITAVLVHLKGHARLESGPADEDQLQAFKHVTSAEWIQQTQEGYRHAAAMAGDDNIPLYFVGFSMGGLIGPYLLQSSEAVEFEKMILFSPALSIRAHAHILKLLRPFAGMVIPSSSPEYYRANHGTPIAGYNAFYSIYGKFRKNVQADQLNIPALIVIHPRDEFISAKGITKLKTRHNLSKWNIHTISDYSAQDDSLFHLTIDKQSVGKDNWKELWKAADSLLGI